MRCATESEAPIQAEREPCPPLYNGPLETLGRTLVQMAAAYPRDLSWDELSPFDHAVVHGADFGGAPSLHPANPRRGNEIHVRAGLLPPSLALGATLGLLDVAERDGELRYAAVSATLPAFLDVAYGRGLLERARWLFARYDGGSLRGVDRLLDDIVARNARLGPDEDWADETRRRARFAFLDATYASDLLRMEFVAACAEGLMGMPMPGGFPSGSVAGLRKVRDAARSEFRKVEGERKGLAETVRNLPADA